MEIKDLQIRQGDVDIVVDVIDISEPREFQKFGTTGRVATATVKDATGECKLTLWNEDVDKIKKGNKVHITNGYVNEYQGEMQLTSGKFGKLEVVGEADAGAATETKEEKTGEGKEEKAEEEVLDVEEEKVE